MVDFTIDKMLTELRNESKIDNDSIVLFPSIGKQDISPSQQNKPFNSSSFNFFVKKKFEDRYATDKKHPKVREHCYYTCEYRGAAHTCNLKYSV